MNKFLLNCFLLCALTFTSQAATYTVTNTNDAGLGSLRQAVIDINLAGTTGNIIAFNIPGIAPHTINLLTALPAFNYDNTTIDGTTQPANGYAGVSPKIVLNGPGIGNGLTLGGFPGGASSKVYGLLIKNFAVGVFIDDEVNCVIGAAGKGNVIQGNSSHGIEANANSGNGTVIKGNIIGLDITGSSVVANGGDGIRLTGNSMDNSVIGGAASGERNIISGNSGNGIYINANSSSGNVIKGNYIGPDATGTLDRGNGLHGVNSGGNGTGGTLGGNLSGEGNVISGNNQNGMYASASNSATWTLKGNYIGTNAAGTAAIPNTLSGLDMIAGSNSMTFNIGGTAAGDGNLISGNGTSGLRFREATSDNYTVYGNKIGTDVTGTANIGNTTYGIYIDDVSDVQVGGTTNANQKNIIAFNGREGVYVHGSNSIIDGIENDIHRNSFFCNSKTSGIGGILLDNGGNSNIAAPVIVTAGSTGCTGTSPGSALIEIFYDDSCTFCEGKTYIGSVTATAGGNWTYTGALSSGNLVATANLASDGTSQFSNCFPVCALAASASSSTPVSCFGTSTGSASVTPTTGTPSYTYLWSPGGQTTSTATGLSSGNYTATVTDAGGCTKTATVAVTQPSSAISSTLTASSPVSCNGGNNGSATVTPGGGTPNYTYLWTGGQTTSTATGLTSGNYTVTVRDANGCSSTQTVSISQPSAQLGAAAFGSANVNCNGGNNGSATVTPGGGTPNYTYLWTPTGQTTPNATGLGNGSYTVQITDARGCTYTRTVSISQPSSALSSTVSASTNVNCNGGSDGTATVTAGGGTANYTYLWNPSGQTSPTATGLGNGTYTVNITDANGCTTTNTVAISQPSAALTSTVSASTNVNCNGGNDGTATVTPGGGTANYTYLWSPSGQTSPTATGLGNGTYTVNITDANGCTTTNTVAISQPSAALTSTVSASTNVNCNGGSDGTATVTPGGGTPNYTYLWNPGGQGSPTATGLGNGIYTVTITDANGCSTTNTVSITQPVGALTSTVSGSTNVNCNGGGDGTAVVTPGGGTPNYTYFWSPSGQTSPTATGLSNGTYTVLITDANGCTSTSTVSIAQPSAALTNTFSSTLAGCSVSNGTATANPAGGTPNYTYLWSNGQSAQTATALAGGIYTVTITDNNGCTHVATVNVGSTIAPTATASATQATCGSSNGTATVTPSGGTPVYTYNWSNGQSAQTATGFSPGTYTVLVTDNNGCTATASITVSAANGPTVSIAATSTVVCNGGSNGSSTVSISGGTAPFTFQWSNGQTTPTATGLTSGSYTVVVRDLNNCSFTTSIFISEPTLLGASVSPSNVSCNGGNNGSATVTAGGGTPGYTYFWSNGQSAPTATGLTAGSYTVIIVDANGCTATNTVSISEPTLLTASLSATSILCNGGTSSATVTPGGGTPNYTYSWSNGQTTPTGTGLLAGSYTVVTTDLNGCTVTNTITISEPALLTSSVSATSILCNGGTASATASPVGGTPMYTYVWSNGQASQTATGLAAGSYTVTIRDQNGCSRVNTITITQPSLLTSSAVSVNSTCNGGNTGSVTVTPVGGTSAYTYLWSGGQATANVTGLGAGTYTVIIRDANGCTTTASATVTEPPVLVGSITGNSSFCLGEGTVLGAAAIGGTPAYTYLWSPGGETTQSITVIPTASSSYTVAITDANGCNSAIQVFNITVYPSITALFDSASAGGAFSVHYSFTDLGTGGTTWFWDFGDGTTSTLQHPIHSFPGAGTYTVTQIAYSPNGCPDTFQLVVRIPEGIIIPNVFTPNHDGPNDVWYIPNSGMEEFHVVIFDRWGAKVWEVRADEIRWDGRSSSGQTLSDGTYYYILHAVLKAGINGKDYSTTGWVTLLTGSK